MTCLQLHNLHKELTLSVMYVIEKADNSEHVSSHGHQSLNISRYDTHTHDEDFTPLYL